MQGFTLDGSLYLDALQICGVIGAVIYVGGFALVQVGHACGNGTGYSLSKIIAAVLVLASLSGAFNLGAFLIQVGFIVFGLWGLFRRSAASSPQVSSEYSGAPLPWVAGIVTS